MATTIFYRGLVWLDCDVAYDATCARNMYVQRLTHFFNKGLDNPNFARICGLCWLVCDVPEGATCGNNNFLSWPCLVGL